MEYVLLLVVAVSLAAALAYQIFTPLQAYLKSYMGDYIACLLETGELPSLGNPETAGVLQDAGCNAKFQPATLKNGRPPTASSSSGGDSSKSSGDFKSGSGDSDGGSGVGGSSSSSSSSGGRSLLNSPQRGGPAMDGPGANDGKKVEIALDAKGGGFFKRSNGFGSSFDGGREKRTTMEVYGVNDEQKKKQEQREGNKRTVATGENFGPPPKKIPVKKPELKPQTEDEDQPMTIGNFFRILLIAAIIIAIVIVLGSQALKIAKSEEK